MSSSLYRPALDMGKYHFQRYKHGLRVTGTWIFKNNRHAPCLVLTPANALPLPGVCVPVVIELANAWRYAATKQDGEETIGDPEWVGLAINDWLGNGYLPGNPHEARDHFRILDAINENLRDLFNMPPRRPTEREVVGDITITNQHTGKSVTKEISDHV